MARCRGRRGPYRLLTATERAGVDRGAVRVRVRGWGAWRAEFGCGGDDGVAGSGTQAALVAPAGGAFGVAAVVCRAGADPSWARGRGERAIAGVLGRRRRRSVVRSRLAAGSVIGRCAASRAIACTAAQTAQARRVPRRWCRGRGGLERRWSPQQIAARLKADHPDDPEIRISHETIYRSLYVQSRGELRRELTAQLRTGRITRRARGPRETRGQIRDMVADR